MVDYKEITIGDYLWTRCKLLGKPYNSRRLNALPGDFALPLFQSALKSGLEYAKTCHEQECAAAASGDARWYHYGFLLVTYGVGMKNILGYISMDVAEQHRTLYVSGAADPHEHGHRGTFNPGQTQLVHHYEQALDPDDLSNQYKAIAHTGIPCAYINDPATAIDDIDRVLEGMEKFSCPGYIEVQRSMAKNIIKVPTDKLISYYHYWDKKETNYLIDEFGSYYADKIQDTVDIINKSTRPVIIIGNLVRKYDLKNYVQALAEKTGAVITSTQLGIGVFSDNDPLYAGVYGGKLSSTEEIREYVESSDCIMAIGISERETNSGLFTAQIDYNKLISINALSIHVNNWKLETANFWADQSIKLDTASLIEFKGFLKSLSSSNFLKHKGKVFKTYAESLADFCPPLAPEEYEEKELTIDLMINLLNNHFITPDMRLISDFGDCALIYNRLRMGQGITASSVDGHMNTGMGFLYASQPQGDEKHHRSLLLLGDGAANMNLSAFISLKVRGVKGSTIIILKDNCYKTLYMIDRGKSDPSAYTLPDINYENLNQVADFGDSFRCNNGKEFLEALQKAKENDERNTLIVAELSRDDCSPSLRGLTSLSSQRNK